MVACGDPTATSTAIPVPPTVTSAPATTRAAAQTTRTTVPATTRAAQTTQGSSARATTAVPYQADNELTAVRPEKAVVKTFTDDEGRTIKLVYGRGTGHGGDYGWAHILGKHINGIWYDGGTITTYPKALGTKSAMEVVNLIGKSLEDKNPDNAGGGRRSYVYAVPNTRYDVFTVVGNDGTIITAYPVTHGSKDEDS